MVADQSLLINCLVDAAGVEKSRIMGRSNVVLCTENTILVNLLPNSTCLDL